MDTAILKFTPKFILNNDPKDITVIDKTDWASSAVNTAELEQPVINISQVEEIVRATLPTGTIFYDGSFVTPDIDRSATDEKTGIEILLDANDQVIKGTYKIKLTYRITDEIFKHTIRALGTNTSGDDFIEYTGNYLEVLDNATALEIIGTTPNTNDMVVTIKSRSYNSTTGRTRVVINESLAHTTVNGQLQVTSTMDYELENEYSYNYTAPEAGMKFELDIDKSELKHHDTTVYPDNLNSFTRVHTLKYPTDLVPAVSDVVQSGTPISINPVATNGYVATLASTIEIRQTDGLFIQDIIEGTNNIDVQEDTFLCEVYECMKNIRSNYDAAITSLNHKDVVRWGQLMLRIDYEFSLYQTAKRCGETEEAVEHLKKIKSLAEANNCSCKVDVTGKGKSKYIIPVVSGGLTANYYSQINQLRHGAGVPSSGLGNNMDYYIDTNTYDLYYKNVTWSVIGNIKGADGTDGADGADGVNGANGTSILFSHLGSSVKNAVTTGYETFTNKTFSIPSGTLQVGDGFEVICDVLRGDPTINDGRLRLQLGSYNSIIKNTVPATDYYTIRAQFIARTLTEIYAMVKFYSGQNLAYGFKAGMPAGNVNEQAGIITVPDLSANALVVSLQTEIGVIQTMTAYQMIIKRFKA